jgi:hypothetical protein
LAVIPVRNYEFATHRRVVMIEKLCAMQMEVSSKSHLANTPRLKGAIWVLRAESLKADLTRCDLRRDHSASFVAFDAGQRQLRVMQPVGFGFIQPLQLVAHLAQQVFPPRNVGVGFHTPRGEAPSTTPSTPRPSSARRK